MNVTTLAPPSRARLGAWPYDPVVAHLVLLDHHMVPDDRDVAGWVDQARQQGKRAIRTGALFPPSTAAFERAGFEPIDHLTLLELRLDRATTTGSGGSTRRTRTPRLTRLTGRRFRDAAIVDRAAFADPWANDTGTLIDIADATPRTRARCAVVDDTMAAFAISGRAGRTGYVQRLAVDPSARRQGHGHRLVVDALAWMGRHRCDIAMVNTAVDNVAALSLYDSLGFRTRPNPLTILELALPDEG